MEASSSSKVTVEYHDPSGVFSLIAPDLADRLPLRNLNWQSPSRPLRSIKSLHVEFIPDRLTLAISRPELQRADSRGARSIDIINSAQAVKERRHQIPGLRQTPYLKVYLLRCDDKDTYKATERARLRDWIRNNPAASHSTTSKGRREEHDACEWLIVHVVLPDSQAASEPRWKVSSGEKSSDEFAERAKISAKWPGRSTRTVFDKLRADFNSSKTAPDRVAQIRLQKDKVRLAEVLPGLPVYENYIESTQEQQNAWQDLISKLKTLILIPFDLRVRQYEEDVAEKDTQRALPGWNFCTFFVLKEGLARGLESVGLVEDALAIYDELNVGLETTLRDDAAGKTITGSATTFADYTEDIKQRIVQSSEGIDKYGEALGLFDKDYREEIVTSRISIFEFFCYIFQRQKALLLRLGKRRSEGDGAESEDLTRIAEVCKRGLSFIHTNSRVLRQDLRNGAKSIASRQSILNMESLSCSWTYSAAGLMLEETTTSHLQPRPVANGLMDPPARNVPNGSPSRSDFSFGMGANPYPQRSSSLAVQNPKVQPIDVQASRQSRDVGYEDSALSPPGSSGQDGTADSGKAGLAELAQCRAELLLMQRKMLETLAKRRNWLAGWAAVKGRQNTKRERINFNDDAVNKERKEEDEQGWAVPFSTALRRTLVSEESFRQTYESLSEEATRYLHAASHVKAAETVMGDLAMLRYQMGDYANAAAYFHHVLPNFMDEKWSFVEAEAMDIYATCLKKLHRKDEYVRVMLSFLAKVCARNMARELPAVRRKDAGWFHDETIDMSGLLPELIAYSECMPHDFSAAMESYFSDIRLSHEVEHFDGIDGFLLRLWFRHVLDDDFELDQVSVRLVHADEPSQEIWASQDGPINVTKGKVELELEFTTNTFGPYLVDKIVLNAKKLRFVHELQPVPEKAALGIANADPHAAVPIAERPSVFLYPPLQAFNAVMAMTRNIHIEEPHSLELELSSGWNEIESIDLRLTPASAGLRLHVADIMLSGLELLKRDSAHSGPIRLGELSAGSTAKLKLPYTLEIQLSEVLIRLEARYHTSKGSFTFVSSVRIPVELPLDVDVHDIFRHNCLFSNFSVRTTSGSPLSLIDAKLDESSVYSIEQPPNLPTPMHVLDQQPVRLMYRIKRKDLKSRSVSKNEAALALTLRYQCAEEVAMERIAASLRGDIRQSQYEKFERLLIPLLLDRAPGLMSARALDRAMHVGELDVPTFAQIGWQDVIATLPDQLCDGLAEWLQTWHAKHLQSFERLEGLDQHKRAVSERSVTISVDVPTVDVVHTAGIKLPELNRPTTFGLPLVSLGHTLPVELSIRHTRQWSASNTVGAAKDRPGTGSVALDFVYDVHADVDTWLIAGERRAQFTAREDEELTFGLTLIPLRIGCYQLPTVDVQLLGAIASGGVAAEGEASMTCETNYQSYAQVVQVFKDVRTTSAHVGSSDAAALGSARVSTASNRDVG